MTHSINSLSLEDCISILLSRLDLPEGEEATQEQLEAEFEVYKAELIAEEEARLAEVARIADLKARFEALSDVGLIQGSMSISNPAAYFKSDILAAEPNLAESLMMAMEQAYHAFAEELNGEAWLKARQSEYAKIDHLLMEAVAEKEAGRPEKMEEYLELREQIKLAHPKPE